MRARAKGQGPWCRTTIQPCLVSPLDEEEWHECEEESVPPGPMAECPYCGQSVSTQTIAGVWTQAYADGAATGVQSPCAGPTLAPCVWYGMCSCDVTRDAVTRKNAWITT